MKKIIYFFTASFLTAAIIFVGCKKKTDPIPSSTDPFLATSVMTPANKGNSGAALTSIGVDTLTGTAKIRLDVTSAVNLDKIYILKSVDNGPLIPVSLSSITNVAGQVFSGDAPNYSLSVPAGTQTLYWIFL